MPFGLENHINELDENVGIGNCDISEKETNQISTREGFKESNI